MYHTAQVADAALFENLRGEMRRGYLIASVLAALNVEQYGYSLRKRLADEGLDVDEGTLYPLLRRLETQGLLASEWREEGKRNKRFYRLSASGAAMLGLLLDEWRALDAALSGLLREFPR
jgi:PadR family transcriptional regulator PadR